MTVQQISGRIPAITIQYSGHEIELYNVEFEGTYEHDPGTRYYSDGSGDPPIMESCVWTTMDQCDAVAQVRAWIEDDMGWLRRWFQSYDGDAIIQLIDEQLDEVVFSEPIEDYL